MSGPPPGWGPPDPYRSNRDRSNRVGLAVGGFVAGVSWGPTGAVLVGMVLNVVGATTETGLVVGGLLVLLAPVSLLFFAPTRRFGAFMLIGLATVVIVLGGLCVGLIALLSQAEAP